MIAQGDGSDSEGPDSGSPVSESEGADGEGSASEGSDSEGSDREGSDGSGGEGAEGSGGEEGSDAVEDEGQKLLVEEYKLLQAKLDRIADFRFRIKGWAISLGLGLVVGGFAYKLSGYVVLAGGTVVVLCFGLMEISYHQTFRSYAARISIIERIVAKRYSEITRNRGSAPGREVAGQKFRTTTERRPPTRSQRPRNEVAGKRTVKRTVHPRRPVANTTIHSVTFAIAASTVPPRSARRPRDRTRLARLRRWSLMLVNKPSLIFYIFFSLLLVFASVWLILNPQKDSANPQKECTTSTSKDRATQDSTEAEATTQSETTSA